MIPEKAQPKQEHLPFSLDERLESVVSIRSEIPEDAFTARILGTEREGSGVVIDGSGLILTIGYLVNEAERIWLTTSRGEALAGHALGYDFASGFGLVQALSRVDLPAAPIGTAEGLPMGQQLVLAAGGGMESALATRLVGRREFAGYWEYLLDEALFTMPAHPHWGGAACLGPDGKLVGLGSLLVQVSTGKDKTDQSNMVVPIDLLPPVLETLTGSGKVDRSARPWLGLYASDHEGAVIVIGTAPKGPAAEAGVEEGDLICEVADVPIGDLADFYRQVWSLGEAGVEVPLTLLRNGRRREVTLKSADRASFLKQPRLH